MTFNDLQAMSDEELQALILLCVRVYSLRVLADWKDIKYHVDVFHHHQRTIEEALDALEHEDREQQ